MIVPPSYQVFDTPVTLSDKDCARLQPHMTQWTKLNDLLLLGVNEPDLQRMVIIELLFKQRRQILDRLLARLSRLKRKRWQERVDKILTL